MTYVRSINSNQTNRILCSWNKATASDIELYKHCIYTKLDLIACFIMMLYIVLILIVVLLHTRGR